MKKRKFRFPVKFMVLGLFGLGCIGILLWVPYRFLTTSYYFQIKDVIHINPLYEMPGQTKLPYSSELIGENIFKVDLLKESKRLCRKYPEYRNIIFYRNLPDRITISFKIRQAVALLRLTGDFYVDQNGVLFRYRHDSALVDLQKYSPSVPEIIGFENKIPYPRSGQQYNQKALQTILQFINQINKDNKLAGQLMPKEINASNINDIILFTSYGCRINLGGINSLGKNLSILGELINKTNLDFKQIEYIDLRFREPVVRYKS